MLITTLWYHLTYCSIPSLQVQYFSRKPLIGIMCFHLETQYQAVALFCDANSHWGWQHGAIIAYEAEKLWYSNSIIHHYYWAGTLQYKKKRSQINHCVTLRYSCKIKAGKNAQFFLFICWFSKLWVGSLSLFRSISWWCWFAAASAGVLCFTCGFRHGWCVLLHCCLLSVFSAWMWTQMTCFHSTLLFLLKPQVCDLRPVGAYLGQLLGPPRRPSNLFSCLLGLSKVIWHLLIYFVPQIRSEPLLEESLLCFRR